MMSVGRGYPLGETIETGEVADNAITLAKLAGHTGEGVQVFDAAGDPAVLDGGTADQAVKMNSGGTALEFGSAGAVTLLGSGSVTGAGTDTWQTAGNFSTAGDLGTSTIVVEIFGVRTGGAGAGGGLSLDHATASGSGNWEHINQTANCSLIYHITKNKSTATKVNAIEHLKGVYSLIEEDSEFDCSAAEQFFVNFHEDTGTTWEVSWIAYLITG